MHKQNLHTHGIFADGKDDYESIVQKAIELKFDSIGFSEHAHFDDCFMCMTGPHTIPMYKAVINNLKKKYEGIIPIYLGLEFENYSNEITSGFDYIIGSFHYVKKNGEYLSIDNDFNFFKTIINDYYGGNSLNFARDYYEQFSQLYDHVTPDIVGHFDLITKYNEREYLIDVDDKKYRSYAIDCLEELIKKSPVFEVNTGAISRGYRTTPYPHPFILEEMYKRGAKITVSSDCHNKNYLDNYYDKALNLIKSVGYKTIAIFNGKEFVDEVID